MWDAASAWLFGELYTFAYGKILQLHVSKESLLTEQSDK